MEKSYSCWGNVFEATLFWALYALSCKVKNAGREAALSISNSMLPLFTVNA